MKWTYKWWLPDFIQPKSCIPTLKDHIKSWQVKIGEPGYEFTSTDYKILALLDDHLKKGGKKTW